MQIKENVILFQLVFNLLNQSFIGGMKRGGGLCLLIGKFLSKSV